MKYLREFENHAAYETAESSLILPNVSLCVNENEVHYNPYVDPYVGHEYVEIGGLKWATMNLGANSITEEGNIYSYKENDVINENWGGAWHTPTKSQLESLRFYCKYTWETNFNGSGVSGGKFTDRTDDSKYLFFPEGRNLIWSITNNGSRVAFGVEYNTTENYISTTNRTNPGVMRGVAV